MRKLVKAVEAYVEDLRWHEEAETAHTEFAQRELHDAHLLITGEWAGTYGITSEEAYAEAAKAIGLEYAYEHWSIASDGFVAVRGEIVDSFLADGDHTSGAEGKNIPEEYLTGDYLITGSAHYWVVYKKKGA